MKMRTKRSKRAQAPAPRRGGRRHTAETKRRKKISTTIAPEGYALLERLIASGKAVNLAEGLDVVLAEALRAENRARLDRATAAHYENASDDAMAEENELAASLSASVPDLLYDE